jgi:hypothetical protein
VKRLLLAGVVLALASSAQAEGLVWTPLGFRAAPCCRDMGVQGYQGRPPRGFTHGPLGAALLGRYLPYRNVAPGHGYTPEMIPPYPPGGAPYVPPPPPGAMLLPPPPPAFNPGDAYYPPAPLPAYIPGPPPVVEREFPIK